MPPRPNLQTPEKKASLSEKIVAKLRRDPEDGSLSNRRVEQYALLRAEEVMTTTGAWNMLMMSSGGNLPSSHYQANIHKSPAFKARLEELMEEKRQLGDTLWGRLEWQARQLYRKCAALNDVGGMQRATDSLMKIAQRLDPPPRREREDEPNPRGRGAPSVEEVLLPDEDYEAEAQVQHLLSK